MQVISDLLKPERQNLTIKEDRKRGVFVDGLSEWVVRSPQEVRLPQSGIVSPWLAILTQTLTCKSCPGSSGDIVRKS